MVYLQQEPAVSDNRGVAGRKPTVRTTVLLPIELHAALKEIAERDRRSMHREIIYALERFAAERAASERTPPGIEPADLMEPKEEGNPDG